MLGEEKKQEMRESIGQGTAKGYTGRESWKRKKVGQEKMGKEQETGGKRRKKKDMRLRENGKLSNRKRGQGRGRMQMIGSKSRLE